jgi:hypothetical protein
MIEDKSSRARLGIARYQWGIITNGDRAALIKYGLAVDGTFPGDPGANKWTLKTTDPQGRPISVKRLSRQLFEIRRDWSEPEAAAYRIEEDARRTQQEKSEQARALVKSWPTSAAAFRDEARTAADFGLQLVERMVAEGLRGGYRYDEDTALRVRLMADKMRELIDGGTIVKDLALRERATPACIADTVRAADAAKRDMEFQKFIAGVAK